MHPDGDMIIFYVADAVAVWIVIQIITGKIVYRRGVGYRQENPRAFWFIIGLESLVVVPMLCLQLHWDTVAMAVGGVLFVVMAGFAAYVLWLTLQILLHPRELLKRIAEDPKEALRVLFFGR